MNHRELQPRHPLEVFRLLLLLLIGLLVDQVRTASAQGLIPDSFGLENSPLSGPLMQPPPPLAQQLDLSKPLKMDVPPNEIEPQDGRHWYYPWTWFPKDGWTNSLEAGINGSEGNAQSFSIQGGMRFRRKVDISTFELRMTHNRTQSQGIETQNNTLQFADYERHLGGSPWSWFVKQGLEYDEFRAFDVRLNLNSGFSYRWFDTDKLRLVGRFGSGTSREFGGPDNRWVPEAVFGGDYEHQWNDRNRFIFKFDYFPDWSDFSNFRIVADMAWEYLMSEERNLSLKLGAVDRYDSTPNGLKPNDLTYSLLLLYKF